MITDTIASKHLGKKSELAQNYNPTLLVAVPREENRRIYNINSSNLPFDGYDIWHCYEFSALTKNGLPFTRLLKLKYDCKSDYIIESKSLKLYLNSFNMTRFELSVEDSLSVCKSLIEKDLSEKLKTDVCVNFIDDNSNKKIILDNYTELTEIADTDSVNIEEFKENPSLLICTDADLKEYRLKFSSLRSNCRVTHQPDFADVFIYYKSNLHIDELSLIKYLVSFRSEYHFHEECVDMIYKRLSDILNINDELAVCALYTRRGGIDINPLRISKNCKINDFAFLSDIKVFSRCGVKQ